MTLPRILAAVAALLVVKVTVEVTLGYVSYFPPDFRSDFLRGREKYFFSMYQPIFYAHIASGPPALIAGMVLLSDRFRRRCPGLHRGLGRCQALNILGIVTPTGLWMAYHASAGTIAAIGFAVLAILTATFVALGWRAAVKKQFRAHRRWMWRCYLLLCSAVLLRLLGGLGTVLGVQSPWFDPMASWASWILPLIAFELNEMRVENRIHLLTQPGSAQRSPVIG